MVKPLTAAGVEVETTEGAVLVFIGRVYHPTRDCVECLPSHLIWLGGWVILLPRMFYQNTARKS